MRGREMHLALCIPVVALRRDAHAGDPSGLGLLTQRIAILLAVAREWVKDVTEFQQAVQAGRDSGRVLLLLRKDEMQRDVVLTW
jgi:hypothetical protein